MSSKPVNYDFTVKLNDSHVDERVYVLGFGFGFDA